MVSQNKIVSSILSHNISRKHFSCVFQYIKLFPLVLTPSFCYTQITPSSHIWFPPAATFLTPVVFSSLEIFPYLIHISSFIRTRKHKAFVRHCEVSISTTSLKSKIFKTAPRGFFPQLCEQKLTWVKREC